MDAVWDVPPPPSVASENNWCEGLRLDSIVIDEEGWRLFQISRRPDQLEILGVERYFYDWHETYKRRYL